MSKIAEFLKETGTFFLATVDGNKPKLRPLGAYLEMDNKIIFGVGNFKAVYRQLAENPYTEIVACKNNGHWLRYSGKAVFETDGKYADKILENAPHLKNLYSEESGNKLMTFHLEEATAVDIAIMGDGENLI